MAGCARLVRLSKQQLQGPQAQAEFKMGSVRAKMAAHNSDLRDQVVGTLRDNNGPMETLAIAHSLGLRTRKQINPTLYKMQQQGTILKVSESPPKWGLKHEVTLGHESQVTGHSSPLRAAASAAAGPDDAEERDMSLGSENMPSLEYAGSEDIPSLEYADDDAANDLAVPPEMDRNYDRHAGEVGMQGQPDRYDYPQNERKVQYKDSPLRESPQGPLQYGDVPTTGASQGDSITEMEGMKETRGNYKDTYGAVSFGGDLQDSSVPLPLSSTDEMESLDQQDTARNGFPNVPTMAEAIEFLKPPMTQLENRGGLHHRLLSVLCTMTESIHSNELAKLVGLRSKKEINPTLFGMQKQGLVRKVSESPPLWVITPYGRQAMQGQEQSNHQVSQTQQRFPKVQSGPSEGPHPSQRNQFQPQYSQQQQQQWQLQPSQRRSPRSQPPAKNDSHSWHFQGPPPPPAVLLQGQGGSFQAGTNPPGDHRVEVNHLGQPYSSEWITANRDTQQHSSSSANRYIPPLPPQNSSEFEPYHDHVPGQPNSYDTRTSSKPPNSEQINQVLQAMSSGQTLTTTDIMKAIGSKTSRDINPTLYTMFRSKLLERVQEAPPIWRLSQVGQEEMRRLLPGAASPCLPRNPQELVQQNSGWRAGPNSLASTQPHIMNAFTMSSQGNSDSPATLPSHSATGPPSHNAVGLSQNASGSSQNLAGASVSSEMFGAINKNPISALTEYAQSRHLPVLIDMVNQHGPPHNPRFTFCARVGNRSFTQITSRSKKDGRREAADVALRTLIAEGNYQVKMSTASLEMTPGNGTTFYDRIAGLSHQAFNAIAAGIPDNISGRKVLAALVMKRGEADEGTVISLGTGNRCVTGDMLSLEGGTVNDSHAEIITRRAFLRYLYNQLAEFKQNPDNTILVETSPGRFRVRPGVSFHLYISTAPCGDGAQFSRTDAGENAEGPEGLEFNGQAQHLPTFGKNIQGLLRTKMEYGEGTIPVDSSHPVQTWDGIIRGERLRTMSCSDKVARWNILGLQGALLSHFVEPMYLSSLTLGSLYHHGHLSRAVCCRLSHSVDTQELTATLPAPYSVHHPQLGCVTAFDPPRGTEKTKALSINWFVECGGPEVTDGTKGRVQGVVPSQLCKSALFAEFQRVAGLYGRDDLLQARTYHEAKGLAVDFAAAKAYMKEAFKKGGYGVWIEKPVEEELFSL
ncbi:double-stranded RNA-specific editase 1-like isoform X2 [Acanthaster planci]|uniref:Double-stranded RNA-specific editase 1-like isoform X2 n=1 Tax=Acanthaster planci TaxID=133434 RepID=A0A8B7Z863_ACAPL|nr:double-stranded RNA-specific editase 1-like isoform X2 [Acanthaster planci]